MIKFRMKNQKTFLVDLDNCIFRFDSQPELRKRLEKNISEWIRTKFKSSFSKSEEIKNQLYVKYGGAPECFLKASIINTKEELGECIKAINEITNTKVLPDKRLQRNFSTIKGDLCLYTNAPINYAEKVLSSLGIRKEFSKIFDITYNDLMFKSNPSAYIRLKEKAKINLLSAVMVDDSLNNLLIGQNAGIPWCMWTKYGQNGYAKGIETIESIYDLR